MTNNLEDKAVKEALKKVIDYNGAIPYKAEAELKVIIELEHNSEKLIQECFYICRHMRDNPC